MPPGSDRLWDGRRVVLTIGLAVATFVAVALATSSGPVPMAVEGTGGWFVRPRPIEGGRAPGEANRADQLVTEPVDPTGSDVVGVLIEVAALAVVAVIILLVARAVRRGWRDSGGPSEPVGAELAAPTGTSELTEAVDDGIAGLADGPIDDVIIACWVRLEAAAAAGGIARLASETPAELTVRMLARFDVPGEPVERLLSRYRAARYSRHQLDVTDRAEALAALHEIRTAIAGVPA